ncbi:MAG TPA: YggS family pyridoxal phosphate-dependent enzyme [Bacteroidales bacterium]|nr:YggS family pyridoxal phosphate-dependent enzyme [Bacteroidales bacterium]HSA42712.1 YggS family pyridoxal phosphate-dependent enzyme [Bacteroidales bacterium]
MKSVSDKILEIKEQIPSGVSLIVVTKQQSADAVMEAYRAGQRDFGENRAGDLLQKAPGLPADIRWHFIGHLQTNKVKSILPYVSLIHSIDSFRLLQEVDKESIRSGKRTDCLLQFHIAREQTKFGLNLREASELLESSSFREMRGVRICGLMGMATFTDNPEIVSGEFNDLAALFKELKNKYFRHEPSFCEISMGMTGDYPLAIACGSTMIRLGTAIFG